MDTNATAPLASEVLEAMLPWMQPRPANPASVHRDGQRARDAVEAARRQVAALLPPGFEVVFTSGGTEADNLAVWGLLGWPPQGHVAISAVEHPAVTEPAAALEALGVEVTHLPVDELGRVDPASIAQYVRDDTRLISVMAANNEVGARQPIVELAAAAHAHGVPLHSDAVQAAAWLVLPQALAGADMLTLSGHKIGGPPGIGALALRPGVRLEPQIRGGGQQRGLRPGTEPTALIVGFGAAYARVAARRDAEAVRIAALRDRLEQAIVAALPDVHVTCGEPRLPNTSHLCFADCNGTELVACLDLENLAASAGSACHSGVARVSSVLEAMRVPPRYAPGALRLSLGYHSTEADVDGAIARVTAAVGALRDDSGARAISS